MLRSLLAGLLAHVRFILLCTHSTLLLLRLLLHEMIHSFLTLVSLSASPRCFSHEEHCFKVRRTPCFAIEECGRQCTIKIVAVFLLKACYCETMVVECYKPSQL